MAINTKGIFMARITSFEHNSALPAEFWNISPTQAQDDIRSPYQDEAVALVWDAQEVPRLVYFTELRQPTTAGAEITAPSEPGLVQVARTDGARMAIIYKPGHNLDSALNSKLDVDKLIENGLPKEQRDDVFELLRDFVQQVIDEPPRQRPTTPAVTQQAAPRAPARDEDVGYEEMAPERPRQRGLRNTPITGKELYEKHTAHYAGQFHVAMDDARRLNRLLGFGD